MLLQLWKERKWEKLIGWGQIVMIAGILMVMANLSIRLTHSIPTFLKTLASISFWDGFTLGAALMFFLVSIVLHIGGLVFRRRQFN